MKTNFNYNNGYLSEIVSLEDQVSKAAERYQKSLWNNNIQGENFKVAVPIPKYIILSDGTKVDFHSWMAKHGATCALTHIALVAGWLLMQNKGEQGWFPYWHSFNPENAPHLAVDPDSPDNFFLCGGNFKMTNRGVEG